VRLGLSFYSVQEIATFRPDLAKFADHRRFTLTPFHEPLTVSLAVSAPS
jgi:hypothetical protein